MPQPKRPSRWRCALLGLLLLSLLLYSGGPAAASGAGAAEGGFKVVAYYPSWRPDSQMSKLQYDVVTHVNYAFAIPTADGTLRPLENPDGAQALIRQAHANGAKVLLAVGGWSNQDALLEPVFAAATATAEKCARLADAIVDMCGQYGFDGVDLDWEYPRTSGTYRQYEQLLQALSLRLRPQGKLLTAAVIGGVTAGGYAYSGASAFTDAALACVDWINVMAYDGDEGSGHSTYEFAAACGRYWRETRGLPAEKVVLGIPFYARPGSVTYSAILNADPSAWERDTIWYQGKQIWYNGAATVAAKTAYALDNLGGVMIWEVTQDSAGREHSLLSVIGKTSGFSDVSAQAWYAADVAAARRMNLVCGDGQGLFSPNGETSWASAVALAARVHAINRTGRDLDVQGSPWYQPYCDYALRWGILTAPLTSAQAEQSITRGEFADLLSRALPAEALPAINASRVIPDVPDGSPYSSAVQLLYRAGVAAGVDEAGNFRPNDLLHRCESTVLCLRMLDPSRRLTVN